MSFTRKPSDRTANTQARYKKHKPNECMVRRIRNGSHIAFDTEEFERAYTRLRDHALGHAALTEWAAGRMGEIVPKRAVLFWDSPASTQTDVLAQLGKLAPTRTNVVHSVLAQSPAKHSGVPDAFLTGLRSQTLAFEEVFLLTYHVDAMKDFIAQASKTYPEVAGVKVISATIALPKAKFEECIAAGHSIRCLSDYIRGQFVMNHARGGWVTDGDCLFLQGAPTLSVCAPAFGHFTGTMAARPGQRGTTNDSILRWELEYCALPQDCLFVATPMAFAEGSPILLDALRRMEDVLMLDKTHNDSKKKTHNDSKKIDNTVMHCWTESFRKWGCTFAHTEDIVCSPIPMHKAQTCCVASKRDLPHVRRILRHSLCVNNFWSSTAKGQEPFETGSETKVDTDSTWAILKDSVLGPRKRFLGKRPAPDAPIRDWGEKRPALDAAMPFVGGLVPAPKRTGGSVPVPEAPSELQGDEWPQIPEIFRRRADALYDETCFPKRLPQTLLSRFSVQEKAGKGRDGEVIIAKEKSTGRMVCVKITAPGSSEEPYLHDLCSQHTCIPTVYDFFASPYFNVIVMEQAAAKLSSFLSENRGTFPSPREEMGFLRKVAASVARALGHMHSKAVLHLDVHSGNILIRSDGAVLLADFGRAFLMTPPHWNPPDWNVYPLSFRPPELFFSPGAHMRRQHQELCPAEDIAYVPPSKITCEIRPALDIWALGCCLASICGEDVCKPTGSPRAAIRSLLLAGCPSEAIQKTCGWRTFFTSCDKLGVRFPQPRVSPSRLLALTSGKLFDAKLNIPLRGMLAWSPAGRPSAENVAKLVEELDDDDNADMQDLVALSPAMLPDGVVPGCPRASF